MNLLLDLTLPELEKTLQDWGEPRYRASQIWEWLYKRGTADVQQMTNLPRSLRDRLGAQFICDPLTPIRDLTSADEQTRKIAFRLLDGEIIETVWMQYERRRSVCVSTQVGCGMGCTFCATGQGGFRRHLTAGEIVAQVLAFSRLMHAQGERVTNVVFMGMGEPFANYDATRRALTVLTDPSGLRLGARRLTVSTVGLVPGIRRFAAEATQVRLAVSLHAPDDTLRNELVPVNRTYPLSELMSALRDYVNSTRRRVTFEYALIDGVNDKPAHARALASLLTGVIAHVNLIPLNPIPGSSLRPTPRQRAHHFRSILDGSGIPCTVRLGRGIDIQAACGQLRAQALPDQDSNLALSQHSG